MTQEWAARLYHELSYFDKAVFVTLTYNCDSMPADGGLWKRDVQLWLKRLRKDISPIKIKYYLAGEYGDNFGRPHYHAIIFGIGNSKEDVRVINDCWGLGYVKCGTVTYQSINYVTSYVIKKYGGEKAKEIYGEKEPPFLLCSKGIGLRWAEENNLQLRANQKITIKGKQVGIPRYYVKKLEMDLEKRQNEQNEKTYKKGQEKLKKYKDQGLGAYQRKKDHQKMIKEELESRGKMYKKGTL